MPDRGPCVDLTGGRLGGIDPGSAVLLEDRRGREVCPYALDVRDAPVPQYAIPGVDELRVALLIAGLVAVVAAVVQLDDRDDL